MAIRQATLALLAAAGVLAAPAARAGSEVLDQFVGRWQVRVQTLVPAPAEVTYDERYEWVLDGRFLRGRTENKSDGTEDVRLEFRGIAAARGTIGLPAPVGRIRV